MVTSLSRRSVKVIMLGRMGFIPAFDIQTRYARQHLDEISGKPNAHGEDTLLLVEHSPVYTVGIRNKDYTQDDVTRLKSLGAQFCTTNRGGLITFHGPGQLVAYPVLNLRRFQPSMKWYVCQLEKMLIEAIKPFGLIGHVTDNTGVWVGDRKIASIGLHGTRYVTTHGVSLNCDLDLSWFKAIEPCGLKGVEMTSLTRELEKKVTVKDAAQPFLRAFQQVFDCDLEYRMLEKNDMKTLNSSNTTETTGTHSQQTPFPTTDFNEAATSVDPAANSNVNTDPGVGVSRVGVDQQQRAAEIGVRQISTLASSPSSSPLSSSSSSSLSSFSHCSTSSHSDGKTDQVIPRIIRRFGPMW